MGYHNNSGDGLKYFAPLWHILDFGIVVFLARSIFEHCPVDVCVTIQHNRPQAELYVCPLDASVALVNDETDALRFSYSNIPSPGKATPNDESVVS